MSSPYLVRAAQVVEQQGMASLRVSLRGADRNGGGIYHAGLVEDLTAFLRSSSLSSFRCVYVLGFSLGGHLALRWATDPTDARVCAVGAIGAPLNLSEGATFLDKSGMFFYRRYILSSLREIYQAYAIQHKLPMVPQTKTLREYDSLTVVPHFGFSSVDEYYQSQSVGGQLHLLKIPALYVGSRHDPIVPPSTVTEHLGAASDYLTSKMVNTGGHVAFPNQIDLGFGFSGNVVEQMLQWMRLRSK